MRKINYNYEEIEGYVSIWFGRFDDLEQFEEYVSQVYCAHENTLENFLEHFPGHPFKNVLLEEDFNVSRRNLFLEANRDRPFEEELNKFYDESFNQFGYDFGILYIDEDTIEKSSCKECTNLVGKLLEDWEEEFVEKVKQLLGDTLEKSYNAVFVMFDSKYSEVTKNVNHDKFEFDYMGLIKYNL